VNENLEELRRVAMDAEAWKQTAYNAHEVIRELKARSLATLQMRVAEWRKAAYPDTRGIELQALGVAEESGELCHAVLKYKQGIRGYDFAKTHDEVADAIGDIIIYAMGVADTLDISVEEALFKTVEHVINRNITQGSDAGCEAHGEVDGPCDAPPRMIPNTIEDRQLGGPAKGVDYAGHVPAASNFYHEPVCDDGNCPCQPTHHIEQGHIPGRPPRRATDAERNTPTHRTITGRLPKDIIEPPYGCE
jgi:NTP pyrophosphatase (non-canonical NTP hydrolase)